MLTYESDEKRLNNDEPKHPNATIKPSNKHVNVLLNRRSINEYICDMLAVVYACFILQTCSVNENFIYFKHSSRDDFVNESDDKSGFGEFAEIILTGPHCFTTEKKQVFHCSRGNYNLKWALCVLRPCLPFHLMMYRPSFMKTTSSVQLS